MAAYYNEVEPTAAAWLRNLIAEGLIAPGDVDERDIRDVTPADLAGYTQCHFFAGVGLWSYALRSAGWDDSRPVWTGSCPCQPFSAAGKGKGFLDERHLWPAWHWLIQQHRPGVIFGEQVEGTDGRAWLDLVSTDLEAGGYACGPVVFPSAGVGAPNIRHRLYWVADATRGGSPAGTREPGRGYGARQPDGPGDAGRLADANGARAGRHAGDGQGQEGSLRSARHPDGNERGEPTVLGGATGRLADSDGQRQPEGRPHHAAPWDDVLGGHGGTGRLEHSDHGRQPRITGHEAAQRTELADSQSAGRLVNAGGAGLAHPEPPDAAAAWPGSQRRAAAEPGRPHDPWGSLEWIACTDGKFRPTQSSVQRVVAGNTASMEFLLSSPETAEVWPLAIRQKGDVQKLRAYGNAINPAVAAEFIAAYLDVEACGFGTGG